MADVLEEKRAEEIWTVREHRYQAAILCGLNPEDAEDFAYSGVDIGKMRALAEAGCAPELILRILR